MWELEPNEKLFPDHIPFILHWYAGGCWFPPSRPWGVDIISLTISKREIHGYKVPSTYTTNFLWVLYVFLGVPGNLGSNPCSWNLEQQNSLKTRLAPFSYKANLRKKKGRTTQLHNWHNIFKQMMLIYETFIHNLFFFPFFCCCCDGRIVHRANTTSVIGIQTLHWL